MSLIQRARAIVAAAAVIERHSPATGPIEPGEPEDLTALFAVSDGLALRDGTRLLPRGEIAAATEWLRTEKSLEWDQDLWVVGERDDLVIVRDLDRAGQRAGGGVLEAPTDGLSDLKRTALGVLGYLEDRAGLGDPQRAPERRAREAVKGRDAAGIAAAVASGFYPGAEREVWHALLTLGAIAAEAGDEAAALAAFARAVEARVTGAARGAEASERAQGWKACAIAAEKAGAGELAGRCRAMLAR